MNSFSNNVIEAYKRFALTTAIYPNIGNNWQYPLIGLTGEIGELANKLKKSIRDDKGIITDQKRLECKDELGDLLWYFVILCFELRINPIDVIEFNVKKLSKRKSKGTIHDKGRKQDGT